jgi:hypothetical protein
MPFRRFLHIVSKIAAVMNKSITYVQDELFSSHKITNLAELTLSEERRRLTDGEPAKLPGGGGPLGVPREWLSYELYTSWIYWQM